MKNTKLVIITVIAVLFLVFLLQNMQVVTISLFFWKIRMARIVFMLSLLLLGFVLGIIATRLFINKRNRS